jgi:hypothetical protein
MNQSILIGSVLIIVTVNTNLSGGTPDNNDSTTVMSDHGEDRPWTIGLPLWIPGFSGKFAVGGIEAEGEPEEDNIFDQIFSSEYGLDFYFVALVNYRWREWRFHADIFGGSIGKSAKFMLNDKSIIDANIELIMPRVFASYNFLHRSALGPISHWNAYLGGRMYFMNLEVSLLENRITKQAHSSWFTFLIGTEMAVKIVKRLHLIISGDIGGFTASKKLTIFGQATFNYRPWQVFSVNLGLALIHIEDESDKFRNIAFKANLFGPTLGLAFHF